MESAIKYIIGIDFGHGETSAVNSDLTSASKELRKIKINNSETIISAFAESNGLSYLGTAVYNHDLIGKCPKYAYFKAESKDINGEKE